MIKTRICKKIGQILLQLLQDTNEPERIWLGNLSTTQISYLKDNISPVTIEHFTQAQLNNVFLTFSRILAEGALRINQHRQIIEQHTPQLAALAGRTKDTQRGKEGALARTTA